MTDLARIVEAIGVEPFHKEDAGIILNADVLDALRLLPDQSIQCCITSPPYWGLRDYGTATWEGGDVECDHQVGRSIRTLTDKSKKQITNTGSYGDEAICQGECCPHCGAVRIDQQLGLEKTPEEYVEKMVTIFREVRRVLKDDGTLWLNLGDSYAGSGQGWGSNLSNYPNYKDKYIYREPPGYKGHGCKPKDLVGIPWMVAFALRADGWYLRSDIIWSKPNPMPESVKDRPTKSHEYIFLMSKSQKYYYDADAIKEDQITPIDTKSHQTFGAAGGKAEQVYGSKVSGKQWNPNGKRNARSVWTITTQPYPEAHFATFPELLADKCILAGSRKGDIVIDIFGGSGTVAAMAKKHGRRFVSIELNKDYCRLHLDRLRQEELELR